MSSNKLRLGLLLFFVTALAAYALLTGRRGRIPEAPEEAAVQQASAREAPADRIPGIPGKRRTHRMAVDKSDYTRLEEEGFPLNVNPEHVLAKDAPLEEGDLVMGVVIDGEARAYPVNYMMGPANEVVNDTLGGQPIASTW